MNRLRNVSLGFAIGSIAIMLVEGGAHPHQVVGAHAIVTGVALIIAAFAQDALDRRGQP